MAGQAHLVAGRFADHKAETFLPGTRESFEERSATIAELAEASTAPRPSRRPVSSKRARRLCTSPPGLGGPKQLPHSPPEDQGRVPAHWSTFEGRRSVLASSSANRKAERPVNALLNYVFALLEAEAILACAAVGLDPGLGIVHNDARGRQSMALDFMEPVRPEAEAFVLDMLGVPHLPQGGVHRDR